MATTQRSLRDSSSDNQPGSELPGYSQVSLRDKATLSHLASSNLFEPIFVRRLNMKARSKNLKPGDKVEWNTSRGRTVGVVKKKLTHGTKIKTHKVSASKDNPEFLVESSRSKKMAAHKPEALKKIK
jgi:hypothetical protein